MKAQRFAVAAFLLAVTGALVAAFAPTGNVVEGSGSPGGVIVTRSYTQAVARVPIGTGSFYVDVSAVIAMTPMLPSDVTANLEPLKTIVAGSSSSPTLVTERFFVEIG